MTESTNPGAAPAGDLARTETAPAQRRPNPYVGPRPFQKGETMYGRDREIQELLDLLIAERIVLLHSPSGAGKSSLIQAGLLPKLQEEGFHVLPALRVSTETSSLVAPSGASGGGPNRFLLSTLLSMEAALPAEQRTPVERLLAINLETYLDERPREPDEPASQVLIFDQFEEVLTLDSANREAKADFFVHLGAALRDRRHWALFAMREDFVAALDPYLRPIPTRLNNRFRLDLLGTDAARQAIQMPARGVGVAFADSAAKRLVDDLRHMRVQHFDGTIEDQLGPYVEPVQLQVVCFRLWENLTPDDMHINEDDIEAVGDVNTALAEYYAGRVTAASQATGVRERAVRDWVDRRLITEQGFRGQVLMGAEKSEGLDNRAIQFLQGAHLVRAEKRGSAVWFELAHDRLIQPVRANNEAWLKANLSPLQRQAALWESQSRSDGLLLREKPLAEAERWAEAHADELTPSEKDFLAACQEARQHEEEARLMAEQAVKLEAAQKVAEAERQRAETQARAASQLRRRALALAGALLVALVMAAAAVFLGNQASQNAAAANRASTRAVAQQMTAEAASTLANAEREAAEAARQEAEAQRATAVAAGQEADAQRATAVAAGQEADAQRATAVAALGEAQIQRDAAEREARIALSRQIAAQADTYVDDQPNLGLLLAVEAFHTSETVEAKSVLLKGLQRGFGLKAAPFGAVIPSRSAFVYAVAFSPDGRYLAWGSVDGEIALWDVQRQVLQNTARPSPRVFGLSFNADGSVLAIANADGTVVLVSVPQLLPIGQPFGVFSLSLAFNPLDRNLLAVGGNDGAVRLWDISALGEARQLAGHTGSVLGLAWSPEGKRLASAGSDKTVLVWSPDISDKPVFMLADHTDAVNGVSWSPNGRLIASASRDRTVRLWDAATGDPFGPVLALHRDPVLSVAFSRDSKILASGSADRSILLWDLTDIANPRASPIRTHQHWVMTLAFSLRGKNLLASSGLDRRVVVQEVRLQEELGQVQPTVSGLVKGIAYSPDGMSLLIEDDLGLQDLSTGKRLTAFNRSHIVAVALNPDGRTVAASVADGTIRLWEVATGQALPATISVRPGAGLALAYSADGRTLATGGCGQVDAGGACSAGEIRLWKADTGEPLGAPLVGHSRAVTSLAFSPDGAHLASGGQDNHMLIWDLATSQPLGLPLTGHSARVTSLAFSRDGATLASGGEDGLLNLWAVATGQRIGDPLSDAGDRWVGLQYSPNGEWLASASAEGRVITWDVSFTSWVARACNLAGRNLTQKEWGQFLPREARYHITCEQFPAGE